MLNEQLSTSYFEQFHVKFMAQSSTISKWVTHVHGMSKAEIDSRSSNPVYIAVQTLVEEANLEYTILLTAE